jgi:hypothetical protein
LPCPRSADSTTATSAAQRSRRRRALDSPARRSERTRRSRDGLLPALRFDMRSSSSRWHAPRAGRTSIAAMIGAADRDRFVASTAGIEFWLTTTLRAAVKACTDLALLRRRSKRPRVGLLDHVFWMQPPAATRATDTSSVNSARNLLQSGVASKLDATAWSDSRSEKSKSSRKRERQPAPPSDTCSGPLEAITRAARAPQGSR